MLAAVVVTCGVLAQQLCDLPAAELAAVRTVAPAPGSDLYAEALQEGANGGRLRLSLDEGDYKMSCDIGGPLLGDTADGVWKSLTWLEVTGKGKGKTRITGTKACGTENTGPPKRRLFTASQKSPHRE